LNLRSPFGLFVSAFKNPFPGNGDRSRKDTVRRRSLRNLRAIALRDRKITAAYEPPQSSRYYFMASQILWIRGAYRLGEPLAIMRQPQKAAPSIYGYSFESDPGIQAIFAVGTRAFVVVLC
jgi:hypothetical protein